MNVRVQVGRVYDSPVWVKHQSRESTFRDNTYPRLHLSQRFRGSRNKRCATVNYRTYQKRGATYRLVENALAVLHPIALE